MLATRRISFWLSVAVTKLPGALEYTFHLFLNLVTCLASSIDEGFSASRLSGQLDEPSRHFKFLDYLRVRLLGRSNNIEIELHACDRFFIKRFQSYRCDTTVTTTVIILISQLLG